MATKTAPKTATEVFETTVADLKQGVAAATKAQADVTQKATKTVQDVAAFNQASLAAVAEASKILADGTAELLRTVTAATQASLTETLGLYRELLAVKSPKEALELQVGLTRTVFARAVEENKAFIAASLALAEKAAAPLAARAAIAAETFAALKV